MKTSAGKLGLAGATVVLVVAAAELERLLRMGGTGDFLAQAGAGYHTAPALISGMRRYNDVVRSVALARGVDCVDLARSLDGDGSAFYDDCHSTERGAELVAQAWAEALSPAR